MAKRESLKKTVEAIATKTYQKWPVEKIDQLGRDLIAWFEADERNVFLMSFWASRSDVVYYHNLPVYLSDRSASLGSEVWSRSYARALTIQASRLMNKGLEPKVNAGYMEFLLCNLADMQGRSSFTIKNDNRKVELPAVQLNVGQPSHPTIELKDTTLITPPVPLKSADLGPNSGQQDSDTV